jgi:hypothetical protein
MCRLRHINDPVFSSLKMEGIRLLFLLMWPEKLILSDKDEVKFKNGLTTSPIV